jgi:hypothetical protein
MVMDKVVKGPWDKSGSDETPEWLKKKLEAESVVEKEEQKEDDEPKKNDGEFHDQIDKDGNFYCGVCGYQTPNEILSINLGGLPIMICPFCLTLQVPRKVYDAIKVRADSNIITPS